jgi:hypothetical protein
LDFLFPIGSASSKSLEDTSLFPTSFRFIGPESEEGDAFAVSLAYYGVTEIAVICEINGDPSLTDITTELVAKCDELGINVAHVSYVDLTSFHAQNSSEFWEPIRETGKLQQKSRYFHVLTSL